MKVALLQLDTVWHDKRANFEKVEEQVGQLGRVDAIVLPEMFATGFTMKPAGLAETGFGETARFLSSLAEGKSCTVIGGFIEQPEAGLPRNVLAVYGPRGDELARYAKLHPFSFGGEPEAYAAGSATSAVAVPGTPCVLGLSICYDLRFPELYRSLHRASVNSYTVIANWPRPRTPHWRALLIARAIENQAFVLGVNRVGQGGGLDYEGCSLVVDPQGRVLAEGDGAEGWVEAELDFEELAAWREKFPALQDRKL